MSEQESGRYVRVCPRHMKLLEAAKRGDRWVCPVGRHGVAQWQIYDRQRGRITSVADHEEGEVAMVDQKPATAKKLEKKTLDRRKFTEPSGLTLWIRVLRSESRFGGDPFRILWRIESVEKTKTHKTKKTEQGVASTHADEAAARLAFRRAVDEAHKAGWVEAPIVHGVTGQLRLRPVPGPPAAAAKGRKVA